MRITAQFLIIISVLAGLCFSQSTAKARQTWGVFDLVDKGSTFSVTMGHDLVYDGTSYPVNEGSQIKYFENGRIRQLSTSRTIAINLSGNNLALSPGAISFHQNGYIQSASIEKDQLINIRGRSYHPSKGQDTFKRDNTGNFREITLSDNIAISFPGATIRYRSNEVIHFSKSGVIMFGGKDERFGIWDGIDPKGREHRWQIQPITENDTEMVGVFLLRTDLPTKWEGVRYSRGSLITKDVGEYTWEPWSHRVYATENGQWHLVGPWGDETLKKANIFSILREKVTSLLGYILASAAIAFYKAMLYLSLFVAIVIFFVFREEPKLCGILLLIIAIPLMWSAKKIGAFSESLVVDLGYESAKQMIFFFKGHY